MAWRALASASSVLDSLGLYQTGKTGTSQVTHMQDLGPVPRLLQ